MSETMTYKMQPAGHEEPAPKRKYPEPDKRLKRWFEKQLNAKAFAVKDQYLDAVKSAKGLDISVAEANALLIKYESNPRIHYFGGIILSALYNRSNEKVMIYDLDIPLQHFGYELPNDRILVNKGRVGKYFGQKSKGIILNYGLTEWDVATDSHGLFLNYGTSGLGFGKTFGVAINFGNIEELSIFSAHGYAIDYGTHTDKQKKRADVNYESLKGHERRNLEIERIMVHDDGVPEVRNYLQDLKQKLEKGKNDHEKTIEIIKEFGEQPAQKIKKELNELFKRYENVQT